MQMLKQTNGEQARGGQDEELLRTVNKSANGKQRNVEQAQGLAWSGPWQLKGKTMKLVSLLSNQGTACLETVLTSVEDTPEVRLDMEAQFCNSDVDSPVPGTWTDVSDNEAAQEIFQSDPV
jgi:hypothetical protein